MIGWRPEPARRLLVYISDGSFHYGYDGKVCVCHTIHEQVHCEVRPSLALYSYFVFIRVERYMYCIQDVCVCACV